MSLVKIKCLIVLDQLSYIKPGYSTTSPDPSTLVQPKTILNAVTARGFTCYLHKQDARCNHNEELSPIYHDLTSTPTCYACVPPGIHILTPSNYLIILFKTKRHFYSIYTCVLISEGGGGGSWVFEIPPTVKPISTKTTTKEDLNTCLKTEEAVCQSGYRLTYLPNTDCWRCQLVHDEQ